MHLNVCLDFGEKCHVKKKKQTLTITGMCECWINQYTWWGGPIHSDNSGKFLFLTLKK